MKDLEQLEKKNREVKTSPNGSGLSTPMKKKTPFNGVPASSGDRRPVNYEDKIKELEAKLFGR